MDEIKNIYCIGRNYVEHVHELGNIVPTSPVVFNKPTHAIVEANGQEIDLPSDKGEVHFEAELVIKMGQDNNPELPVQDLISEMTIGLDLTLRDVQSALKEKQHPWLLSKGFPNAAIIGKFIPFPGIEPCAKKDFRLFINDSLRQKGNIQHMIFPIGHLIRFIGENLGLKKGDIIFTGTPEGVGPLQDGDILSLLWEEEELGTCIVKFHHT